MSSTTDDELFASLGNSLMRDLLSDIDNNPQSSSSGGAGGSPSAANNHNAISDNMMNTLSILEEELDKQQQQQQPPSATSPKMLSVPPPGLRPPGLTQPSVASMVVHHAQASATNNTPRQQQKGGAGGDDAWGQALHQFSALSLTEDFLKADSARKSHQNITLTTPSSVGIGSGGGAIGKSASKDAADLVDRLLFDGDDDEQQDKNKDSDNVEEYDITAKLTLPMVSGGSGGGGIVSVEKTAPGFFAPISPSSGSGTTSPVDGVGGVGGTVSPMPLPPPPPQQQQQMMQGMPLRQQQQQGGPPPMGTPNLRTMPSPQLPMGVPMPPPPPHMMAMMGTPPPNGMMNIPPQGVMPHHPHARQLHPHMVVPPPHVQQQHPGGPPFPPTGPGNHNPMSPQPHLQPPQQQPMMGTPHHPYPPRMMHPPPPSASKQHNMNNETNNTTTPSKGPSFNISQSDFPALGDEAPPQSQSKRPTISDSPQQQPPASQPQSQPQAAPRIKFTNPSPTAPPIPASLIVSHSMTSRDLCHVLHSMMRPLLALDPYNADYYRWSYDDRKSRNLLFLGNDGVTVLPNGATGVLPTSGMVGAGGRIDLPNPVWKETKLKAAEIDETFRSNVEKRAADWSKEKHILGKTVKNNVKRPRAMLAAGILTSAVLLGGKDKKADDDEEDDMTDDDRQRARLWASRLASDRGYLAYLNLVELRRLLQSRPNESAALMDANTDNTRREELLFDVEENVAKLHGAFGITKRRPEEEKGDDKESARRSPSIIDINDEVLARTLSLPKGRMLLSRVVDEGILPHPSACRVLPAAIGVLLRSVVNAHKKNKGGSVAPPPGEDRLLRSLTGLARTVQPKIDALNVLRCLESVNAIGKEMMNSGGGEKRLSIKNILTGKRTLMELLHSILSLGGEVCVGAAAAAFGGASLEGDWKTKETEFLTMLSS